MATMPEAYAAITSLNGAQVGGRTLQVSLKKQN
jgi:RNA recognition motif-containing protein